jgi:hypothetical protein
MKTIILILLSFQSLAQDTIPCDMTRQQSRLYFGVLADRVELKETQLQLEDKQHKRDNTKEIKSLRYGFRSLRIENKTIRKQFELTSDSLKRAYKLAIDKENNRNSEIEKALKNELAKSKQDYKIKNTEAKTAKAEARKSLNWNLILIGIFSLIAILGILYVRFFK